MPRIPALPSWLIQADELAEKEIPIPEFVIGDMLPVGLSMLAAPPKAGKSFFALQAGLAIATGEPFLGRSVTSGSVLYLALEDNYYRLQQRTAMSVQGKSVPAQLAFALRREVKNLGDGLEAQLLEWHASAVNPQLIIIDTYGRVMPGINAGSPEYHQQTRILGPLQAMALELGIAILLIHHTNKGSESTDKFDRINGSIAQLGALDAALLLDRERGLDAATLSITGRDFPEDMDIALRFDDAIWAPGSNDPLAPLDLTPRQREIISAIGAGHTATSDIATELGITSSNLVTQIEPLKTVGYVRRVSQGVYELAPELTRLLGSEVELTEYAESQLGSHSGELAEAYVEKPEQAEVERINGFRF